MVDIRMWKQKNGMDPQNMVMLLGENGDNPWDPALNFFFRQPHILEYLGCFIWEYHLDR